MLSGFFVLPCRRPAVLPFSPRAPQLEQCLLAFVGVWPTFAGFPPLAALVRCYSGTLR